MSTIETPQNHAQEAAPPQLGEAAAVAAVVPEPKIPQPRKIRKNQKRLAIGAGIAVLCLLAYWQFQTIRRLFDGLLPYAPVLFPSLIALGTIYFKDWGNYKPKWIRWVLFILVLAACIVGVSDQRAQHQEKAAAAALSQANIGELKGQVAAAQQAQTDNTRQFLESLQTLSDKVHDLQTKVTTEELQKQLATVKAELQKTQKAMEPPPKASLVFTFAPLIIPPLGQPVIPITETTLSRNADGSVHVQFSIMNLTDVAALDGELTLQICDQCKFAKDPAGFKKLEGQSDMQRYMAFDRILPHVVFQTLSADVIAPPSIENFPVAVYYRCKTCTVSKDPSRGLVHIARNP